MKQYCYLCANRCPLDALSCGEGRRMYANEVLLGDGEGSEPERGIPADYGGFASPDGGDWPEDFFEARSPESPGAGEPPRAPDGPAEGAPASDPDEAPRKPKRSPRGSRRPRPDPEEALRRAEEATPLELFDRCYRALHRPDAGALRGQNRALAILAERGEMSQREMQDRLHVQPASMSELIAKLERKGYLTRARGEDRRAKRLRITQAGREAASKLPPAPDDPFSVLSEDQRAQLIEILNLLVGSADGHLLPR